MLLFCQKNPPAAVAHQRAAASTGINDQCKKNLVLCMSEQVSREGPRAKETLANNNASSEAEHYRIAKPSYSSDLCTTCRPELGLAADRAVLNLYGPLCCLVVCAAAVHLQAPG